MLPIGRELFMLVLRTNLMFFYFEGEAFMLCYNESYINRRLSYLFCDSHTVFHYAGLYYHLSKRASGIRYVFIGKPTNQRPRYIYCTCLMPFLRAKLVKNGILWFRDLLNWHNLWVNGFVLSIRLQPGWGTLLPSDQVVITQNPFRLIGIFLHLLIIVCSRHCYQVEHLFIEKKNTDIGDSKIQVH